MNDLYAAIRWIYPHQRGFIAPTRRNSQGKSAVWRDLKRIENIVYEYIDQIFPDTVPRDPEPGLIVFNPVKA